MISQVGLMRKLTGRVRNLKHAYGFKGGDQWGMDIEAAAAEAVVAKYLNLFWSPGGVYASADVGDLVQVRWSDRPHASLILHDRDSNTQPFVLVTGILPTFEIHGWVYGLEGKIKQYWTDPGTSRPAFFVPQHALRPMPELKFNIHQALVKEMAE